MRLKTLLLSVTAAAALGLSPAAHGALLGAVPLSLPVLDTSDGRSCGWNLQISGDQVNALFPDNAATYWSARVPVPLGSHVEVKGRFPYARYTSLVTYTGQLQAIDGINDTVIAPDPGSTNPFLPGANRTATQRGYTVRIVNQRIPATGRARNTLYTENADGSKSSRLQSMASFVLRIYEGDTGRGRTGGVALPTISLVLPTGQRITLPECPDTNLPDLGTAQTLAAAGLDTGLHPELGLGGTNPPTWHKYTNMATGLLAAATDNEITGALYDAGSQLTDALVPSGGFAENPDNKYVTTTFSRDFGQVLVLRGKAPAFPRTREGQPVMGTGQLRYWSICTNAQTTAFYACKQDDQIPTDAQGFYTVAISTASSRPVNATETCGVSWLPAGPVPQSIVILRNMLPDPSFAEAIQKATPGRERETMGAYLPEGRYYASTTDFEALGCGAG